MNNNPTAGERTQNPFSFESLQTHLNNEGYNTYIMPVNSDNAVEQILVSTLENTGAETPPESPVIQIMFVNDLLRASNMAHAVNDTDLLQFFVSLPIQYNKDQLLEMFQLLSVFSRVVPVGAFGLDENGGAFFRYSLMTFGRNIESKLVVEVIKMISFFINKFSNQLYSFVHGQKSLEEVLKETEKELTPAG